MPPPQIPTVPMVICSLQAVGHDSTCPSTDVAGGLQPQPLDNAVPSCCLMEQTTNWMWELDHKEGWAPKNRCFRTVVLRRILRVPWTARKSNQSILKEINPEFIGRTDADVEAPILWPPDAKNWLIGKDSDAGKGWGQEEKGMTEDEMVGWHYWLNGHEFEQALGDSEGQGSLAWCSSWGHKE